MNGRILWVAATAALVCIAAKADDNVSILPPTGETMPALRMNQKTAGDSSPTAESSPTVESSPAVESLPHVDNSDCFDGDGCLTTRWHPGGFWARADYLLWSEQGMRLPALVTTGPSGANPGILGENGTTVLFGDERINGGSENGGRIQLGMWLNVNSTFGFEGEFAALADEDTNYQIQSPGNLTLSRPFFNVGPNFATPGVPVNAQATQLVAFLGVAAGSVAVDAKSQFSSEAAHFVVVLHRSETDTGDCDDCPERGSSRWFMFGFRHLQLDDTLGIQENVTDASFNNYSIHDEFDTRNEFNGAELALKFEIQRNAWRFDFMPRISIGDTHESASINGSTSIINAAGTQTNYVGGLLTQKTNIGTYTHDEFAAVPEIDLNLAYQLTPHVCFDVGYSFIYCTAVARAGNQIDTSVNGAYLPPGQTVVGDATRPAFAFEQSSYWSQGLNAGVQLSW